MVIELINYVYLLLGSDNLLYLNHYVNTCNCVVVKCFDYHMCLVGNIGCWKKLFLCGILR